MDKNLHDNLEKRIYDGFHNASKPRAFDSANDIHWKVTDRINKKQEEKKPQRESGLITVAVLVLILVLGGFYYINFGRLNLNAPAQQTPFVVPETINPIAEALDQGILLRVYAVYQSYIELPFGDLAFWGWHDVIRHARSWSVPQNSNAYYNYEIFISITDVSGQNRIRTLYVDYMGQFVPDFWPAWSEDVQSELLFFDEETSTAYMRLMIFSPDARHDSEGYFSFEMLSLFQTLFRIVNEKITLPDLSNMVTTKPISKEYATVIAGAFHPLFTREVSGMFVFGDNQTTVESEDDFPLWVLTPNIYNILNTPFENTSEWIHNVVISNVALIEDRLHVQYVSSVSKQDETNFNFNIGIVEPFLVGSNVIVSAPDRRIQFTVDENLVLQRDFGWDTPNNTTTIKLTEDVYIINPETVEDIHLMLWGSGSSNIAGNWPLSLNINHGQVIRWEDEIEVDGLYFKNMTLIPLGLTMEGRSTLPHRNTTEQLQNTVISLETDRGIFPMVSGDNAYVFAGSDSWYFNNMARTTQAIDPYSVKYILINETRIPVPSKD